MLDGHVVKALKGEVADVEARLKAVDAHVGRAIRERRVMLGLSLSQLAATLSISTQQVSKYEVGLNRISAGKLFEVGLALGVGVDFFYEGLSDTAGPRPPSRRQRMLLELARNLATIYDDRVFAALAIFARVIAEPAGEQRDGDAD